MATGQALLSSLAGLQRSETYRNDKQSWRGHSYSEELWQFWAKRGRAVLWGQVSTRQITPRSWALVLRQLGMTTLETASWLRFEIGRNTQFVCFFLGNPLNAAGDTAVKFSEVTPCLLPILQWGHQDFCLT